MACLRGEKPLSNVSRWRFTTLYVVLAVLVLSTARAHAMDGDTNTGGPHAVFVIGDREYRSEESMPMLARILKNRYGFEVTLCFSVTDDGVIDPNRPDHIEGLEALNDADVMIVYISWRQLPSDQLAFIMDFIREGGAVAGFRPTVLPFEYPGDHEYAHLNTEWPHEVLGLRWISHHGADSSTDAFPIEERGDHPILNGIEPFHVRSWLYNAEEHVHENVQPLMTGRAVRGAGPDGERFSDPHPVAWTHTRTEAYGGGRTFFTTMGAAEDFHNAFLRRLSLQGIFWAVGQEDQIPKQGLNAEPFIAYDPEPSAFGDEAYKQGVRPEDIPLTVEDE